MWWSHIVLFAHVKCKSSFLTGLCVNLIHCDVSIAMALWNLQTVNKSAVNYADVSFCVWNIYLLILTSTCGERFTNVLWFYWSLTAPFAMFLPQSKQRSRGKRSQDSILSTTSTLGTKSIWVWSHSSVRFNETSCDDFHQQFCSQSIENPIGARKIRHQTRA